MSTTRTISLPPSPGCLASAIKTLHSITESSSVSIVASDKKECSGVMTTVHTPSNSITGRPSHAVSTEGVSGAVRALDSAEPSACLLGATAEERGKVESWIENVESNLLTMLGAEVKVTLAKSVAEEYVGIVSKHLSVEKGAYLVGDYLTAADVITACVLAELMGKVGGMKCADGLRKWMETVAVGACGMKLELGEEKSAAASKEEKPAAATSSDGSISILTDSASVPILATLGSISHTTYTHSSAKTVEELLVACPLPPLPGAPDGTHTKNLFLKDKKHGSFLVTAHPESDTNTKGLAKHLKLTGKVNLRFADVAHLDKCLGCEPGHVGPMCISNDKEKIVTVVLDSKIAKAEAVYSHPGRNDMSTVMAGKDLVKYIEEVTGHEIVLVDFDAAAPAEEKVAPAAKKGQNKGKKEGGQKKGKKEGEKPPPKKPNADKKTAAKGQTLLALQWKKTEHFANWYSDAILLSEMISYYNISGCYILRPWSYSIWESVQVWMNAKMKEFEVDNTYFPLFVSKDRLEREADHVEGFAPEVAWVTKSGESDLAMPIAIRPTSETIMYPAFADWIRSHRDLPMKINQWSNVVRWEFKDPTPFLRSREFLWQEGHTAHANYEESDVMVMQALEMYRGVYEDLFAVPVIKGYKTEKERFAGGDQTTTCEAYIPVAGRAIQGATSHNLGQNFAKMFNINFQSEDGTTKTAWQTSWGCTTRSLGVMIMVHGDDMGLVLPPRVAPIQAVIVPIVSKKCSMEVAAPYCQEVLASLKAAGIIAKFDDRDMYNPGWKYNHWEQKGVPLRIEVGPRDIEARQVRLVTRWNGAKEDVTVDGLGELVANMMEKIQADMFARATKERDNHLAKITEWKDFVPNLEKGNLVLAPWCGGEHKDWEEWAKNKSREEGLKQGEEEEDTCATSVAAKTLCIPFDQPDLPEGTKCFASGLPATCWCLWGRSY